jgi:hypothetical protein
MNTEGNLRVLRTLQAMQIDPDNIEDALKVDADHRGEGGDDGYDMVRYGLMSRPMAATRPPESSVKQDDRAAPWAWTGDKVTPKVLTVQQVMDKALGVGTRPANPHRVPVRPRR